VAGIAQCLVDQLLHCCAWLEDEHGRLPSCGHRATLTGAERAR